MRVATSLVRQNIATRMHKVQILAGQTIAARCFDAKQNATAVSLGDVFYDFSKPPLPPVLRHLPIPVRTNMPLQQLGQVNSSVSPQTSGYLFLLT